jgi:ribosomal protein S27AE
MVHSRPIVCAGGDVKVMNGEKGVADPLSETNVQGIDCDRCGATAVVTRGDLVLCGPCYYTETVRERRRNAGRRFPGESSKITGMIEEIERAVLSHLRRSSCECDKK